MPEFVLDMAKICSLVPEMAVCLNMHIGSFVQTCCMPLKLFCTALVSLVTQIFSIMHKAYMLNDLRPEQNADNCGFGLTAIIKKVFIVFPSAFLI